MKCFGKYLLLTLTLSLYGCKSNNNSTDFKEADFYTKNAVSVYGKCLNEGYQIKYSFKCFYTPNGLLGTMELADKTLIHLADINNGEILLSTSAKGRGPNEFMQSSPHIDYFNGSLYAADMITNSVKIFTPLKEEFKSSALFKINYNTPTLTADFKVISDSLFVVFGYSPTSHSLLLINGQGDIVDSLSYHILEDPKIDHSTVGQFYLSMHLSPCREYLYVHSKDYNYIKKYQIKNSTLNNVETHFLTQPKYKVVKGKPLKKEDNVRFSGNIYVGEKYIYIAANPESRGEYERRREQAHRDGYRVSYLPDNNSYIMVFDHNMNFIQSYLCDANFEWLVLTDNPSIVYVSDYRTHTLKQYQLPNL